MEKPKTDYDIEIQWHTNAIACANEQILNNAKQKIALEKQRDDLVKKIWRYEKQGKEFEKEKKGYEKHMAQYIRECESAGENQLP